MINGLVFLIMTLPLLAMIFFSRVIAEQEEKKEEYDDLVERVQKLRKHLKNNGAKK